ncbi:NAD(P)/FAD-dependent oxidoreductase [uncultured Pseudokineococcus sp.]|uniref:FAD-dependent oxidoreductase n=1 Tax=uncultured Pseudokineococcus sp. TaxID=1642928 RepID=UPI0026099E5B|nr:NAD(P)/FAD-dependent oxidoreductase [uncultured Pseudokineococcus sp.]
MVGGGPAGLAAALGLLAGGHRVTVLERAAALRRTGGAVTLSSGGTAALAALGVRVDDLGRHLEVLESRTEDGRPLMRVPLGDLGRRVGTPTTSVLRRRLVERLAGLLPADVLRLGARVDGVEPHGRRPLVHLDGAPDVAADLLVGADGERSPVRRSVRPGAVPGRTGWTTWQGCTRVDHPLVDDERVLFLTGPAGFCDLQPAGEGLLQWSFSTPPGVLPAAHGPRGAAAVLRARFGGWADPVPAVLAAVADDDLSGWDHRTAPVPSVWGAGAVTLVGDAAHVMPPSLGQGVNQALEDAHALAAALRGVGPSDVVRALRGYEARRTRQVRPVAVLAGSEEAITHRALSRGVMRSLPDSWALGLWGGMVRRSSAALAG